MVEREIGLDKQGTRHVIFFVGLVVSSLFFMREQGRSVSRNFFLAVSISHSTSERNHSALTSERSPGTTRNKRELFLFIFRNSRNFVLDRNKPDGPGEKATY